MSKTISYVHDFLKLNPSIKSNVLYLNIYNDILSTNTVVECMNIFINQCKLYPCGILLLLDLNTDINLFAPYIVVIKKMLRTDLLDVYLSRIIKENDGYINRAFIRLINYTMWLNPARYKESIKVLMSNKIIGKIIDYSSWKNISSDFYKEKYPNDNYTFVLLELFVYKKSLSNNYVYYNWINNKFSIVNWKTLYNIYYKQLKDRNFNFKTE